MRLALILLLLPVVAEARPNFLLILTDDLDAGMVEHLPVIRGELRDAGLSFSQFYVAAPQCCPSRASLLRGQYPHNTGVWSNRGEHGGHAAFLPVEGDTVATRLQAGGYRTGWVGRYLNGYAGPDPAPGWTRWVSFVDAGPPHWRLTVDGTVSRVRLGSSTDVLAARANTFIREGRRPWFLIFAPYAPHLPATPAARHIDVPAPTAPAGLTPYLADVHARRHRSMLAVDEAVGRFLDILRRTGQDDSTYVLFTSDNGFHLTPTPGKLMPWRSDVRVPLLVRGPGVPMGTHDGLASMVDVAPTLLRLADKPIPAWMDGRPLRRLLQGEARPARAFAYMEMLPSWRALRTADGRGYVEWEDGEGGVMLDGPEPAAACRAALGERLEAFRTCRGKACRALENAAIEACG